MLPYLRHLILFLRLFDLGLGEFLCHFGGFFLVHDHLFFEKLTFDFEPGAFLHFELGLGDQVLERAGVGLELGDALELLGNSEVGLFLVALELRHV